MSSDCWTRAVAGQPWVANLTPPQRGLLGFPPPGHRYWSAASLAAAVERYPGWDAAPYVAAGLSAPTTPPPAAEEDGPVESADAEW